MMGIFGYIVVSFIVFLASKAMFDPKHEGIAFADGLFRSPSAPIWVSLLWPITVPVFFCIVFAVFVWMLGQIVKFRY